MEFKMDDGDDFTFCQVGPPADEVGGESKDLASDIGGITIKDEHSNDTTGDKNSGLLWSKNLPNNVSSNKQETVGSLSYSVIDASSSKKSNEASKVGASGASGTSSEKPKCSIRMPAPRKKVPFEKGYSQMDWLRLTQTHPDLAGLKGQSNRRLISMSEVKKHQEEGSMWTVLKGRVYNISPYMKFHPGGVDMLMKAVGKDCTTLFNKYHAWVNAEFLLEKCLVGILDESQ